MPKLERSRQNVIVFPMRPRHGSSDRPDIDGHPGLDRYFNGSPVRFVALSPMLVRHFGTGWRGVVSTGLTGITLGLLAALIWVYVSF